MSNISQKALQAHFRAQSATHDLSVADDRLVGAKAIAEFRGEKIERTRYLLRRGLIPVYQEGATIIASKGVLREHHRSAASGKPEAAACPRVAHQRTCRAGSWAGLLSDARWTLPLRACGSSENASQASLGDRAAPVMPHQLEVGHTPFRCSPPTPSGTPPCNVRLPPRATLHRLSHSCGRTRHCIATRVI
jgi:hypothetical protein